MCEVRTLMKDCCWFYSWNLLILSITSSWVVLQSCGLILHWTFGRLRNLNIPPRTQDLSFKTQILSLALISSIKSIKIINVWTFLEAIMSHSFVEWNNSAVVSAVLNSGWWTRQPWLKVGIFDMRANSTLNCWKKAKKKSNNLQVYLLCDNTYNSQHDNCEQKDSC